jgi:EAL domain-containing protein (putative c-di-GMP-specific phosphodiesterase class I)
LADKEESSAVVRAIAEIARNLNMLVVAVGVETLEQQEQLKKLGCIEMQGFLFSPRGRPRRYAGVFRRARKKWETTLIRSRRGCRCAGPSKPGHDGSAGEFPARSCCKSG